MDEQSFLALASEKHLSSVRRWWCWRCWRRCPPNNFFVCNIENRTERTHDGVGAPSRRWDGARPGPGRLGPATRAAAPRDLAREARARGGRRGGLPGAARVPRRVPARAPRVRRGALATRRGGQTSPPPSASSPAGRKYPDVRGRASSDPVQEGGGGGGMDGTLVLFAYCLFGVKKYYFFLFSFLCLVWHVIERYGREISTVQR